MRKVQIFGVGFLSVPGVAVIRFTGGNGNPGGKVDWKFLKDKVTKYQKVMNLAYQAQTLHGTAIYAYNPPNHPN